MSVLEEAVKVEEGATIKSILSCISPHQLTRDKSYRVNSVTSLYRTGPPKYLSKNPQDGPLCNIDFGIVDDTGKQKDIPYANFYW